MKVWKMIFLVIFRFHIDFWGSNVEGGISIVNLAKRSFTMTVFLNSAIAMQLLTTHLTSFGKVNTYHQRNDIHTVSFRYIF